MGMGVISITRITVGESWVSGTTNPANITARWCWIWKPFY